jgi:hypothetical protein
MPLRLLFWILMLLDFLFFVWIATEPPLWGRYGPIGGGGLVFLILVVVGLKLFGKPVED